MACIEDVHALFGSSAKATFSFGQRLGELEGMLQSMSIGYIKVKPKEWQKHCNIVMPKKATTAIKKKTTYNIISNIYPLAELKGKMGGILDGRSDALGMCHYLRLNYGK